MPVAFEYSGCCTETTWKFVYRFDLGELTDQPGEIEVSLSRSSAGRLSSAYPDAGLRARQVAMAVGEILNSLTLGPADKFSIPDIEVDRYLESVGKEKGRG